MKTIEEASLENLKSHCYSESGEELYNYSDLDFRAGIKFAQRWIPVTEEFPNIGDGVLVKLDYRKYGREISITLAQVNFAQKPIKYGGPQSLTGCGELTGIYYSLPAIVAPGIVTHWRPLEIQ